MANFIDSLSAFDLPDEVQEQLTNAHNEEVNGAVAKADLLSTVIVQKDTAFSELSQKYNDDTTALKAANFDALRTGPVAGSNASSVVEGDGDIDYSEITYDDLFSNPTK